MNDIGPGMQMLIAALEAAEGDYANQLVMPNGYIASIIRTAQIQIPVPEFMRERLGKETLSAGGSYGAPAGLFEVALMDDRGEIVQGPVGWLEPVAVARQLREWFELPPANPWGNSLS